MAYRIRCFPWDVRRELSEYGFPQPQTVENDKFARVYCREIDYNQGEQGVQFTFTHYGSARSL